MKKFNNNKNNVNSHSLPESKMSNEKESCHIYSSSWSWSSNWALYDVSSSRSLTTSDFSSSNTNFSSSAVYTRRITFCKLLRHQSIKYTAAMRVNRETCPAYSGRSDCKPCNEIFKSMDTHRYICTCKAWELSMWSVNIWRQLRLMLMTKNYCASQLSIHPSLTDRMNCREIPNMTNSPETDGQHWTLRRLNTCYSIPTRHCHRRGAQVKLKLKPNKALDEKSSSSYRVSPAIWDHTVLPATPHKWTCP